MILNQTARTENKIIKIDCSRLMQKLAALGLALM